MAIDNGRADWTGTPWHDKDIPFMWATVAHHSPDAYATHLAGWRRTTELLSAHVARMRTYRDNLALAWNPTRSPAAAVYLARFDSDIANAQATLDASVANYTAYTAAMHIVSEAQTALRPLAEEFAANATAEASRQEMTAASSSRAGAAAFLATPDTQQRQAELTGIARSVMYRASQHLIEATAALQMAPKYHETGPYFPPTDTGVTPPAIPNVNPLHIPPSVAIAASDDESTKNTLPTNASGPSLAGIGNETNPLTPAREASISENHRPNANTSWPPTTSPQIIGTPLDAGDNSDTSASRKYAANPGTVIGVPPYGGSMSDSLTTRMSPTNPSSSIAANSPLAFHAGAPQRGLTADENRPMDPDTPWLIKDGVQPVLDSDPPPEPINAGPAIGIDK